MSRSAVSRCAQSSLIRSLTSGTESSTKITNSLSIPDAVFPMSMPASATSSARQISRSRAACLAASTIVDRAVKAVRLRTITARSARPAVRALPPGRSIGHDPLQIDGTEVHVGNGADDAITYPAYFGRDLIKIRHLSGNDDHRNPEIPQRLLRRDDLLVGEVRSVGRHPAEQRPGARRGGKKVLRPPFLKTL